MGWGRGARAELVGKSLHTWPLTLVDGHENQRQLFKSDVTCDMTASALFFDVAYKIHRRVISAHVRWGEKQPICCYSATKGNSAMSSPPIH